jgi:hypothetical protein
MGFTHDRALSHDRGAFYHCDMALKLYEEWGAKGKVAFLSDGLGESTQPVRVAEVVMMATKEKEAIYGDSKKSLWAMRCQMATLSRVIASDNYTGLVAMSIEQ